MNNNQQLKPIFPVSYSPSTVEYAGFLRRLLAVIIDELAFIGVFLLEIFVLWILLRISPAIKEATSILQPIFFLILIGFQVWNKVYLLGRTGGTIGKHILGIKVVKVENMEVIGMGTALLRETIGKFLSSVILNIGYLMILWDKRKQALHDKVVDTIVIKKD